MNALRLTLFTLALTSVAAAQTGRALGPPSSDRGVLPVNSGAYDASDFSYTDPHAPGYHPLGAASSTLVGRDEVAAFMPTMSLGDVDGWVLDDRSTFFDEIDTSVEMYGNDRRVRAAAAGNVGDDAAEELVTLRQIGAWDGFVIDVLERDAAGEMRVVTSHMTGKPFGQNTLEGRITLGDVDGDLRDEIVVTGRPEFRGTTISDGWMCVYDDPSEGFAVLFEFDYTYGQSDLQPVVANLDGPDDPAMEIAIFGEYQPLGHMWILAFDDGAAAAPFAQLGDWVQVENVNNSYSGGRVTWGDFDADGIDEICVATVTSNRETHGGQRHERMRLRLKGLEYAPGAGLVTFGQMLEVRAPLPANSQQRWHRDWDATTASPGPGARDEVVVNLVGANRYLKIDAYRWNGTSGGWTKRHETTSAFAAQPLGVALTAADVDSDGVDEIVSTYTAHTSASSRGLWLEETELGSSTYYRRYMLGEMHDVYSPYAPALAAGDFDADGLVIEPTGEESITLADPIPMMLLVAPPTKAGIDQNRAQSSTVCTNTTTQSTSVGVSTSTSLSVYQGVTTADLFEVFSASAKQSVESALERNHVTTSSVANYETNTAGADGDVMVFQGTLYHGYEYRVISATNASMVGQVFQLNVPVQTKVYQWTTDLYNSAIEPAYRIPQALLGHTIGDPSSYPTFAELQGQSGAYLGLRSPGAINVPQGGSTRTVGFAISDGQTSSETYTMTQSADVDFTVGLSTFGASYSVSTGSMYSVSVEETTDYSGTLGGIVEADDWFEWQYDAGLAMYHYGVLSDGTPVAGTVPFQVVTYWVEPVGWGY